MNPKDIARLRSEFEVLEQQFSNCAQRYGALHHEWFWAWQAEEAVKLSETQWAEFKNLNPENPDEASPDWFTWDGPWELSEDQNLFGRFLGDPTGFDEFVKLAEVGSELLRECDMPSCKLGDDYATWLYQLHQVALLYPTSFLRIVIWNWDTDGDGDSNSDGVTHWINRNGVFFPSDPKVHSFEFDIFTSSAALCRVMLEPKLSTFREDAAEGVPNLTIRAEEPGSEKSEQDSTKNCWIEQDGWYVVTYPEDHDRSVLVESRLLGARHVARLIEAAGNPLPFFLFDSLKAASSVSYETDADRTKAVEAAVNSGDVHIESGHGEAIYEKQFLKDLRETESELLASIDQRTRLGKDASKEESQLAVTKKTILEAFNAKGDPRRFTKDEIRRRYNAINEALKVLYKQLREKYNSPSLANHLDDSINWKPGLHSFIYEPQANMEWKTQYGILNVAARSPQRS